MASNPKQSTPVTGQAAPPAVEQARREQEAAQPKPPKAGKSGGMGAKAERPSEGSDRRVSGKPPVEVSRAGKPPAETPRAAPAPGSAQAKARAGGSKRQGR